MSVGESELNAKHQSETFDSHVKEQIGHGTKQRPVVKKCVLKNRLVIKEMNWLNFLKRINIVLNK